MSLAGLKRPSTWEERGRLKLATRASLVDAGGAAALVAEDMVRVGAASLSRASTHTPANAEHFVAMDVALDLDRLAGEPRHARALAEAQGWKLVPMAATLAAAVCLKAISGLFQSCAAAKLSLMAAMEDGRVDRDEAIACDARLAELEAEVGEMRARLRRAIEQGDRP